MTQDAKTPVVKKRAPTLYLIIGFKLLKGMVALLLGLKVRTLNEDNLPEQFQRLLHFLHVDPEKKFFVDLADRVADITPANLQWIFAGTLIYASFMLLQAGGLVFRVGWIVWFVIGESAFFVPVEIFEIVHRPSLVKCAILITNILIVWYLYANRARLIVHHHHH